MPARLTPCIVLPSRAAAVPPRFSSSHVPCSYYFNQSSQNNLVGEMLIPNFLGEETLWELNLAFKNHTGNTETPCDMRLSGVLAASRPHEEILSGTGGRAPQSLCSSSRYP